MTILARAILATLLIPLLMSAPLSADIVQPNFGNRTPEWIPQFQWTNADIVALGAVTTGELTVTTLPPQTAVLSAYIRITGQAAGVTTLTVSAGPDGSETVYLVAGDAKASVGTVYGDASAELGTALSVATGAVPSFTASTTVKALFTSSGGNLNAVTGSSGTIWLILVTLP